MADNTIPDLRDALIEVGARLSLVLKRNSLTDTGRNRLVDCVQLIECALDNGPAETADRHPSNADEAGEAKQQARDEKATRENEGLTPSGSARMATVPFLVTLRLKFADGFWWIQSDDLPGIFVHSTDPCEALSDLIPMWKRFNELRPGQCPAIPDGQ